MLRCLANVAALALLSVCALASEPDNAGWALAVDDDLLLLTGRDKDYTGGVTFTVTGQRAKRWSFGLDRVVSWLEAPLPASVRETSPPHLTLQGLQLGALAFTPNNLNAHRALFDDRPYASLLFMTASRSFIATPQDVAYDTSVTAGVLGLPLAGSVQLALHELLHAPDKPNGWTHQISAGGEPTLRLGWGRQALLVSTSTSALRRYDVKWRADLSAGYLTEGSVSLSGRWGRIATPWWNGGPEHSSYALLAPQTQGISSSDAVDELYFSAGLGLRLRAYNALLQGQFRRSEVSYAVDDLERLIGDAWVGVTWQTSATLRWSYQIQFQTPEIKRGTGHRSLLWAGLVLSYCP